MPRTSRTSPPVTKVAPRTSWLWPCASLLSESRIGERISAATPTGMLTKKIHSQERRSGVGEDPAHQDARCCAGAADRAPGAERDVALAAFGEGRGQDRERRRRDRGRAEPLEGTCRDERGVVPRQAAQERAHGEDHEAAHEDASPVEDVGEPPTEKEEAAEDECVGAEHPLQVLLREAEIRLDRRQRHVDDRDIEDDHELHGAEQRQRELFRSVGCDHRSSSLHDVVMTTTNGRWGRGHPPPRW
jgi:hypothetical protein